MCHVDLIQYMKYKSQTEKNITSHLREAGDSRHNGGPIKEPLNTIVL